MKTTYIVIIALALFLAAVLSGCVQPSAVCGNGICEIGETFENCPQDCPPLGIKTKPPWADCSDHLDNDGDGYCDIASKEGYCEDGSILGDPNCTEASDTEGVCVSSVEVCDGFDNDCDGKIDEQLTETRDCGTDVGECSFGAQRRKCEAGVWEPWSSCTGGNVPKKEKCDGEDNDCDGKTDEGCNA